MSHCPANIRDRTIGQYRKQKKPAWESPDMVDRVPPYKAGRPGHAVPLPKKRGRPAEMEPIEVWRMSARRKRP